MSGKTNNYLLWGIVAALTIYTIVDDYIIGPLLSTGLALIGVFLGAAIAVRYIGGFWDVLVNGRRNNPDDGAHLVVVGISFIAFSVVYTGAYSLLWNIMGRDESWIGSPAAQIGRVLLIIGCLSLYLAPDTADGRLTIKAGLKIILIFAIAMALAYLINDAGFMSAMRFLKLTN